MLKTLKRWLSHHKNHQIGTYMDRWYIIPPQWNLPISVRLQHIKRADGERVPHNHPYAFKSIVLKGWYTEEKVLHVPPLMPGEEVVDLYVTEVLHERFKLFRIAQKVYHRIIDMPASGVWTLIWHPRKPQQYEWGYLNVDGTHIPHADYVRPPGYDLPYKASAYRREGPKDPAAGPEGPAGDITGSFDIELRGSIEVQMPRRHVIDFDDTRGLLSQIHEAAAAEAERTAKPEREWFMTEEVLPVQVSPTAEARIKEFLDKGGKIEGERE